MKTFFPLVILFFFLVPRHGNAQLSGIYSVGDSTCAFVTIQDAIDSLLQVGTAGNVCFRIKPGEYSSFSLSGYQPGQPGDTLFFQAEPGTPGEVVIRGETRVTNSSSVYFRHLRFEPWSGQELSCVGVDGSDRIRFDTCAFINPYSNCFTSMEALLSLSFPYYGSAKTISVTASVISSPDYTIYIYGATGVVGFLNDTISGAIDWFAAGTKSYYTGNVFNLNPIYMTNADQTFRGNTFNGTYLNMEGDFYSNTFHCPVYLSAGRIYNNCFTSTCNVLQSNMVSVLNNRFEQDFDLIYCNNSTIAYNRFLSTASFVGDGSSVTGNFFYGITEFTQGGGYRIKNNNFSPDGSLNMQYTGGEVENNNIGSMYIRQPAITTISNNNYNPAASGFVNIYGMNPFFYDPGYVSSTDLHATNPALIRKSTRLDATNGIRYDVDSIPRKTIPTIGANEICFSFQYDTVTLKCDSLCLDLCMDSAQGYYWTPSSLFIDSTSLSPVIHPASGCWARLNKSGTGTIDSVFVNVSNSLPVASGTAVISDLTVHFTNMSVCADSIRWDFGDGTSGTGNDMYHIFPGYGLYESKLYAFNSLGSDSLPLQLFLTCLPYITFTVCGDSVTLESCLSDFNGYYWSPSYLFRDSTEKSPVIFPETNISIYLNHVGQPMLTWTNIFVYPAIPEASMTYTVDSLYVSFTDRSKCADSVRWDFGDGSSSSLRNPVHQYPGRDSYSGYLYAFSMMGSDTARFTIDLTGTGQSGLQGFKIWPNPATSFLVVDPGNAMLPYSLCITDISGRQILTVSGIRNRYQADVSALSPGIYLVQVQSAGLSLVRKIVVN
jgi:hypothetical protein